MICAIASIRKFVACHANYCDRLVEHNMARVDGRKDFKECIFRAKNCVELECCTYGYGICMLVWLPT